MRVRETNHEVIIRLHIVANESITLEESQPIVRQLGKSADAVLDVCSGFGFWMSVAARHA